MSVNVLVFGADKESDEYCAAIRLKEIILNSVPAAATGEIVLFASATLYGQAVKDVDLLMIGEIKSGYAVEVDFNTEEGKVIEKVYVKSFCTTIEIKRHDISGISINGTDIYVKYGTGLHCVTLQSNKQKFSTKDFFEKVQGRSPYITNVIWFTQATPVEIKELMKNEGNIIPSNVVGNEFDFDELMQILVWQKKPYKAKGVFVFDSYYNAGDLESIRKALALFSKTKDQMGELTRRRIEQLSNKSISDSALIDTDGKVSIYRGRAGTGKTVGLIQTAVRLVDSEQARVLMLTYNKALVSDIRRLLALAELPDMFEVNCLHICTLHSYFYRLANTVLYGGKISGIDFLNSYADMLNELLEIMKDEESIAIINEICSSNMDLDWDYILIDEAQDWGIQERDIILNLFDLGKIIIADGGQQFVRKIDPCDWSIVRRRNNIRLKYCLRQKENLVSFINTYAKNLEMSGSKVLTKGNMLGGKVIITSDDSLLEIHHEEIKRLKEAGNSAYDMLYLVPHAQVKNINDDKQFALKEQFEKNGILFWDGTSSSNRESYSINLEEVRLLQYDSARGLEGWTVVCLDFDVFLEEKMNEYVSDSVDTLLLESPEERERKYLFNWAMIPLTRAIDTLVITVRNPSSEVGLFLKNISDECKDYVSWV